MFPDDSNCCFQVSGNEIRLYAVVDIFSFVSGLHEYCLYAGFFSGGNIPTAVANHPRGSPTNPDLPNRFLNHADIWLSAVALHPILFKIRIRVVGAVVDGVYFGAASAEPADENSVNFINSLFGKPTAGNNRLISNHNN
jgi:hypothetical protein